MKGNSKSPVPPMSKKRLTKEQATETIVTLRNDPSEKTKMVYEFDVGEGWSVLGYKSLKKCFDKELPDRNTSYLYRLVRAAHVEKRLRPDWPVGQIPERILRPLTALKNPDDQIKVWECACQLEEEEGKKLSTELIERAIEDLGCEKRRRRSSAGGNHRNHINSMITTAQKLSVQERHEFLKWLAPKLSAQGCHVFLKLLAPKLSAQELDEMVKLLTKMKIKKERELAKTN